MLCFIHAVEMLIPLWLSVMLIMASDFIPLPFIVFVVFLDVMSPSGRNWTTSSNCGRIGQSWRWRTQELLPSLGSSALHGSVLVRLWGGDSPSLVTMFDFSRNGSLRAIIFSCLRAEYPLSDMQYFFPFPPKGFHIRISVAEIWSAVLTLVHSIMNVGWAVEAAQTAKIVPEQMLGLFFLPPCSWFSSLGSFVLPLSDRFSPL